MLHGMGVYGHNTDGRRPLMMNLVDEPVDTRVVKESDKKKERIL